MSHLTEIFVYLPEEQVDVWRPVQAAHLRENVYKIIAQPYDAENEMWQFEPGDEVVCELIDSNEGRILAAIQLAD